MAVVVVLSLALLVAILGVLGVVVVHLLRTLATLRAAVSRASARLTPLAQELQSELAVTNLEGEALQRSLQALRDSRAPRRGIPRPQYADPGYADPGYADPDTPTVGPPAHWRPPAP